MGDTQLDRIEGAIARIEHAVFTGNGTPPVLSRLATLEERTKNLGRIVAALVGAILGYQIGPK